MNRPWKFVLRFVHRLYQRAYTYWKVRETGGKFRETLSFYERKFFVHFYPALMGNELVVYDIGAASGVLSSCLAKLSNVRAVYSFEPLSSAYEELLGRMETYPHVFCHNLALGDVNNTMDIYVFDESRNSSSMLRMMQLHKDEFPDTSYAMHKERVRVVRLDDYVKEKNLPPPDVVKIDVQGYENNVLRGGQNTVCKAEYCILEMSLTPLYEDGPVFDEIYVRMREMGFRLVGIAGELHGRTGRQLQVDGIFKKDR